LSIGPAELAFRAFLMPPATAIMRVLLNLRLRGMRNIPATGPVIVVANHGGYLDPIFLQTGTYRPIRYMMTSDFYDVLSVQPVYRFFRAIRVNENGPARDSIRGALDVLKSGGVVGLFPEGQLSRDGELSPIRPGITFLGGRAQVPIVPAWIEGSYDVLRRGQVRPRIAPVSIAYGPPIAVNGKRDRSLPDRILAAWHELRDG